VKPHEFHPEARAEYADAARYYAGIGPELGEQFYREVESLIEELSRHAVDTSNHRCCNLSVSTFNSTFLNLPPQSWA